MFLDAYSIVIITDDQINSINCQIIYQYLLIVQLSAFDRTQFCRTLEAKLQVIPRNNSSGNLVVSGEQVQQLHTTITTATRSKDIARALIDFSRYYTWPSCISSIYIRSPCFVMFLSCLSSILHCCKLLFCQFLMSFRTRTSFSLYYAISSLINYSGVICNCSFFFVC